MSCQCSRKVVPAGTVRPRAHVKILRRRVVEHRVDHALGGYTNGAWWQSLMFIRVVRRIHLCVGIRDAPLCEITQCIFDCRAGLHGHTDSKAVDIQARYYLLIFRDVTLLLHYGGEGCNMERRKAYAVGFGQAGKAQSS